MQMAVSCGFGEMQKRGAMSKIALIHANVTATTPARFLCRTKLRHVPKEVCTITSMHAGCASREYSIHEFMDTLVVIPSRLFLRNSKCSLGPESANSLRFSDSLKTTRAETIRFETEFDREAMSTEGVRPGEVVCAGKIGRGTAFAKTMSGVTFAKGRMIPPRLIDPYYDRAMKLYYFRITDHAIEPVLPRDAVGWIKFPLVDRD